MARTIPTLAQRFWSKVDRRGYDECWPWLGGKNQAGYGRVLHGGRHLMAHRISWELRSGKPIPEGLLACHSCDNPSCVNPAHIWLGTDADNMADKCAKGRHRNGNSTLFAPQSRWFARCPSCDHGFPLRGHVSRISE